MALPLPGSPSCSWDMFLERLRVTFHGANPRVCAAFWLFGLINNVLYVIILSAALDLVGPDIPKGVILLADVIPSFATKLCAPYFIHLIPYPIRVLIFVFLSASGMLILAFSPAYVEGGPIATKIFGVVLASMSSGGGELSFLGLTHFYGPFSLASWGSGTGGAGLIGAGAYAIATTSLKFSVQGTLLVSACLPAVMLLSFFVILPRRESGGLGRSMDYERLSAAVEEGEDEDGNGDDIEGDEHGPEAIQDESNGLLTAAAPSKVNPQAKSNSFAVNLERSKKLFFPFMLPLLLVYIAEYTINQGVSPTLLFPLPTTPFHHYRAFYPAYNATYQMGVFISRSSTPFFRTHHLYLPSFLQIANLTLLTLHSLFDILPNVYVVFAIIFWEGLLGGLVYVNTFAEIAQRVPAVDREFSLGATTVSDSAGICVAGFVGMAFEVWLCSWQVEHGRDYCRRT